MTTAVKKVAATNEAAQFTDMRLPFTKINEAGAYVSQTTGHLLRIPDDAVKVDRSPLIDLVADEPQVFGKISDDPFVSLTKARMLACDLDLPVRF